MSYFSRLTDIVTCNLSEILANESDPEAAMRQIIHEMEEGRAGAHRSAGTAAANQQRISKELQEHAAEVELWMSKAKDELQAGSEERARLVLARKREVEDLIAGLQQQHKAAAATHEHLTTTLRALEARLAEARRKLQHLESGRASEEILAANPTESRAAQFGSEIADIRAREIEHELEALKRALVK